MENIDTQDILECPYDKHHQILKTRMQVHLVRCRRNHKHVKKVTCPFNVTHVLNEPELKFHVAVCDNRQTFESFCNTPATTTRVTIPPPMPVYQCEDNWDEDEDVPSYNPQAYVREQNVLRSKIGAAPAERKTFRKQERLRLLGINN